MGKPRKVAQFTLDGEYIQTFDSATDAERAVSNKKSGHYEVSLCCKGKMRYCKGYRWLYAEDIPRAKDIFESLPLHNVRGYVKPAYTEREIKEEASKYETKKAFRENNWPYAQAAYKMGIMDELHFKPSPNPYKDSLYSIYVFEFIQTDSAYIGLTDNPERREREHNERTETPLRHSMEYEIPMPSMKILESGIKQDIVGDREDYWKNKYKENGWNILNKAKTGNGSSALGSGYLISTYEKKKTASKYEYLSDFKKECPNLCQIAYKRGIINDLGLKNSKTKDGTYTEEFCYNFASNFKTVCDLIKAEKGESIYVLINKPENRWRQQYWWLYNKQIKPVIAHKKFAVKIFKSPKSVGNSIGVHSTTVQSYIKKQKSIDGWRFQYLDINDIEFKIPDFEHRLIT